MLENRPQEVEPSKLQTFINIIFDSTKVRLDKTYSSREPDEYTMELMEVATKKDGAIRYLSKLIEEVAEERLEKIHNHHAPSTDDEAD